VGLPGGVRRGRTGAIVVKQRSLAGRTVLVTGASGFIGRRVVERLALEARADVRVLVRERYAAARLLRAPIEVAIGDVLRPETLVAAAQGCDLVFHCVKGKGRLPKEARLVEVEGTRNVLEAAVRGGARRAVHLSTAMVYELPADGVLDERSPRVRTRDPYASAKLASERVALSLAERGRLEVVVLQPTVVYGPNAGVYGEDIVEELSTSRVPLVDGGMGTCNALYVDDLVTAMLLAASSEHGSGEAFLVSGPEPVTWREFFAAFERMLGVERTVSVSLDQALEQARSAGRRPWLPGDLMRLLRHDPALRRRLLATREGAFVLGLAQRLLPVSFWYRTDPWFERDPPAVEDELPLGTLRPFVAKRLASRARVENEKARRLLGYEPVFDLDAGMRLTEAWLRWAGLLDGTYIE
jgi:nucleoside-diphosphate-sugar epimerase